MAVIFRTECFLRKLCQLQGIVLFLVLCGADFAFSNPRGCELVRKDVQAKGFSPLLVLDRPTPGLVCEQETCCSGELEKSMHNYSHLYMDKYLKESISKISSLIDTRAKKFDEFFREMMNNSKREFHEMFERTYGKIYLQNSDVFSDFFNELETYYKKGTGRLSETMDNFFGILYQRMFTVINAQYTFDEKYLMCVSDHMAELKPFGDVPHKLGVQLRRSFVATKTFYKSLMKGAEVASNLISLKVDEECNNELTRLQFCGVCKGEHGTGACAGYCEATLQNCLKYHTDFNDVWDNFVDAIEKVAERLIGPYNIEVVVEPLNIKISEAVMNFQESGAEVSQKIYNLCGKPSLNRPKRKAEYKAPDVNPQYELNTASTSGKTHGKKKHRKVEKKVDTTPTLEKLITDIKTKIKDTKRFWIQLPYQYCNNQSIAAPPSAIDTCWNGTSIGPFSKPTPKKLTHGDSPVIINNQVYILQGLTEKLRKAHQGEEVEMEDDDEDPPAGSGSGSGDGGFYDSEGDDDLEILDNDNVMVPQPDPIPTTSTPKSSSTPAIVRTASGAGTNSMSLTRALIQYLLPIVLAWFGGAISDLL